MTFRISTPAENRFEPGQTIWFKGVSNSDDGSFVDPSFAGYAIGDAVTVTEIFEDRDNCYVHIAEDVASAVYYWNTTWFTADHSKIVRANGDQRLVPTLQERLVLAEGIEDSLLERLSVVTAEREVVALVVAYALELLDPEPAQRVFGYWDGLNDTLEARD